MTRKDILNKKIAKFPNTPGVYMFLDKSGNYIYIGRATNIKNRVKSYFTSDLMSSRGPLLVKMLEDACDISFEMTDSVLEAVILEANLIKKHQPLYNSKEKSDKSFNYIVITNEEFPRILTKRGRELLQELGIPNDGREFLSQKSLYSSLRVPNDKYTDIFGPFPYGSVTRSILGIIRKIFPFRDKCEIPTQDFTESRAVKKLKPCFYHQIGLCPGVCVGKTSAHEYEKNINNIRLLLGGRKSELIDDLQIQMWQYADKEEFENAIEIRNKIFALNHVNDVALCGVNEYSVFDHENVRIEAYDIAHLNEKYKAGVMVVFENGELMRNKYRKFNIPSNCKGDTNGLGNMLDRRLKYVSNKNDSATSGSSMQKVPDIIVVDGGVAQINVCKNIIQRNGFEIAIIGVVKDKRHKPVKILGDNALINKFKKQILLANNEAHRFAITWHRRKRNFVL